MFFAVLAVNAALVMATAFQINRHIQIVGRGDLKSAEFRYRLASDLARSSRPVRPALSQAGG